MTKTSLKIITMAALSAIGAVMAITPKAPDAELEQIARHREWTRITPQPVIVPSDFASAVG